MTSTPDPIDDDLIAAEYVVGTLDLVDRMTAENRIKREPAFAARVAAWENRLADLNDDYEDAPAPDLLPQIEARLFPQAVKPARAAWFGRFWTLAGSTAVAVLVAGYLLITPPQTTMVATLSADASPLRYEAAIAGDELILTRVAGLQAEAGKDYELWIIEGDKAPVSLGVIGAETYKIAAPKAEAGYLLAITLEPKGGSPEGKPTGPILAAGPLQSI